MDETKPLLYVLVQKKMSAKGCYGDKYKKLDRDVVRDHHGQKDIRLCYITLSLYPHCAS